jgi:hypothetical protein
MKIKVQIIDKFTNNIIKLEDSDPWNKIIEFNSYVRLGRKSKHYQNYLNTNAALNNDHKLSKFVLNLFINTNSLSN